MRTLEQLSERLDALQALIQSGGLHGKHGKHGRDGDRGPAGRDGRDGKDADPDFIRSTILTAVDTIPRPRDGVDGKDGADCDMARVEEVIGAKALEIESRIRVPADGRDGPQGKQGEVGPRGPAGPQGARGPEGPKGDTPAHEWNNTALRFERPDGTWGEYVDLRGPKGRDGRGGGGGGGSASATVNGYFPQGWT